MSWEDGIRKVVPYVPGEQPKRTDIIKLNTNECPYPPAPGVQKKAAAFSCDQLRLYPDPDAHVLTQALAEYYGVKESQVFVTEGKIRFINAKQQVATSQTSPAAQREIIASAHSISIPP